VKPASLQCPGRFLEVHRSIRTPCEPVWDLLVDTDRWSDWGPTVTGVDVPAQRICRHASGRVKTAVGLWLPFVVDIFEEGSRWSWKVAGIRATGHRIEKTPDRRCRLTFEVPLWAAPYAIVCWLAARRIERICRREFDPKKKRRQ
jgi:hypothetical protein